jgi:hypothetical protein
VTDKPVLWHNPEDIYDITTIYDPEYHQGWTPLYTSPPSSQLADAAVEAAIEATKEKAAKVCEAIRIERIKSEWDAGHETGCSSCAAAIRSMK